MTKSIRREKLSFDDPEALQALCGSNNARLKLIERTAGAQVHLRGNEITIEGEGDSVDLAKSALEQLYGFARRGRPLASDDVVRAVKALRDDSSIDVASVFSEPVLVPRSRSRASPRRSTSTPSAATTSSSRSAPPVPARPTSAWRSPCASSSTRRSSASC
jgi:phosphate starvation-inducible protein PhoH